MGMAELRPCPFCGGPAEIYTGRTFPRQGKALCESQQEALEELERYKSTGVVLSYHIGKHEFSRCGMKEKKIKWAVVVDMQAFIPRCYDPHCLGRTQAMFRTHTDAAEAWNRRSS